MLQPLKITLVICYTVLVLSVAGVLLSGILGRLEWLALCAVCALALLSITLVLGKNLRIQRMMTEPTLFIVDSFQVIKTDMGTI